MASRKGMFAAFADEEEETAPQVQKAAPKKTQVKPAEEKKERPQTAAPKNMDATGFDGVTGAEEQPARGGRGGRGGRGR